MNQYDTCSTCVGQGYIWYWSQTGEHTVPESDRGTCSTSARDTSGIGVRSGYIDHAVPVQDRNSSSQWCQKKRRSQHILREVGDLLARETEDQVEVT